jgi:hypothetical protein
VLLAEVEGFTSQMTKSLIGYKVLRRIEATGGRRKLHTERLNTLHSYGEHIENRTGGTCINIHTNFSWKTSNKGVICGTEAKNGE